MRKFKLDRSITNRDNEVFKIYLKDVSRYPLITAEEEKELARKIQAGDTKAKDKLVTANLRFVISVAKQYQNQGLDLMDLINEGNASLIKAAEKYDPDKGYKFISYAVWWIRQAMIQALSTNSRTVRLPVSQSAVISKIIKTRNKFESENGRRPSNEELSELLSISPEKIESTLSANTKCVSIETPFSDEDEGCLLDIIPNKNAQESDSLTDKSDLTNTITELLESLTIREHDVLLLTYGLLGVQALPYEEIGKRFNLTGERVRQLHLGIIKRIKTEFKDIAEQLL